MWNNYKASEFVYLVGLFRTPRVCSLVAMQSLILINNALHGSVSDSLSNAVLIWIFVLFAVVCIILCCLRNTTGLTIPIGLVHFSAYPKAQF